jgi:hypothetical protein
VITREDLAPGYQAVQAGNAAIDFCFQHRNLAEHWHLNSNYLIYLSTKTEDDLMRIADRLKSLEVEFSFFREPDIGNEVTAVSFISTPQTKKITSGLPLLLKQKQF